MESPPEIEKYIPYIPLPSQRNSSPSTPRPHASYKMETSSNCLHHDEDTQCAGNRVRAPSPPPPPDPRPAVTGTNPTTVGPPSNNSKVPLTTQRSSQRLRRVMAGAFVTVGAVCAGVVWSAEFMREPHSDEALPHSASDLLLAPPLPSAAATRPPLRFSVAGGTSGSSALARGSENTTQLRLQQQHPNAPSHSDAPSPSAPGSTIHLVPSSIAALLPTALPRGERGEHVVNAVVSTAAATSSAKDSVLMASGFPTSNSNSGEIYGAKPHAGSAHPHPISLADALACYRKGRSPYDGVNYYLRPRDGRCVPLPQPLAAPADNGEEEEDSTCSRRSRCAYNDATSFGGWPAFTPPPDTTLVPTISTVSGQQPSQQWLQRQQQTRLLRTPAVSDASAHSSERGRELFSVSPLDGAEVASAAASSVVVRRTHSPSLDSRWLFDEWRLWEGELAGQAGNEGVRGARDEEEKDKKKTSIVDEMEVTDTLPPFPAPSVASPPAGRESNDDALLAAFVTVGRHREENANGAYQIDHFCVDEGTGTVFAFEEGEEEGVGEGEDIANNPTSPAAAELRRKQRRKKAVLDVPDGRSEHHQAPRLFAPADRMFHPSNIIRVPLVNSPPPPQKGDAVGEDKLSTFEAVAMSSLAAFFARSPSRSSSSSSNSGASPRHSLATTNVAAFFPRGTALLYPIHSDIEANPSHNFHSTATAAAMSEHYNVTNILFALEAAAKRPAFPWCSAVYRGKLLRALSPLTTATPPTAADVKMDEKKVNTSEGGEQQHLGISRIAMLSLPEYLIPPPAGVGVGSAVPAASSPSSLNEATIANKLRGPPRADLARLVGDNSVPSSVVASEEANGIGPNHQPNVGIASNSRLRSIIAKALLDAVASRTAVRHRFFTPQSPSPQPPASTPNNRSPIAAAPFAPNTPPPNLYRYSSVTITEGATLAALGRSFDRQSAFSQYASLLVTGHEGCEAFRCAPHQPRKQHSNIMPQQATEAEEEALLGIAPEVAAAHRRCAIPYAAVAVSLSAPLLPNVSDAALREALKEVSGTRDASSPLLLRLLESVATEEGYGCRDGADAVGCASKASDDANNVKSSSDASGGKQQGDTVKNKLQQQKERPLRPFAPDVGNYSQTVWHGAVRLLYREAHALRRDVSRETTAMARRWRNHWRRDSASSGAPFSPPSIFASVGVSAVDVIASASASALRTTSTSILELSEELRSVLLPSWRRPSSAARQSDGGSSAATHFPSSVPFEAAQSLFEISASSRRTPMGSPINQSLLSFGGDDTYSNSGDAKNANAYAYVAEWRARLVRYAADQRLRDGLANTGGGSGSWRKGRGDADVQKVPSPFPIRLPDRSPTSGGPSPAIAKAYTAYFEELFAALLERLSEEEVDGDEDEDAPAAHDNEEGAENSRGEVNKSRVDVPQKPHSDAVGVKRRQRHLICYRSAIAIQITYQNISGAAPGAHQRPVRPLRQRSTSLTSYAPANCHTRQVMNVTFRKMRYLYGQCGAKRGGGGGGGGGEQNGADAAMPVMPLVAAQQSSNPKKTCNSHSKGGSGVPPLSDAPHPLLTLRPAEQRRLRALFAASRLAVGKALDAGAAALRAAGVRLLPEWEADMEDAAFDDAEMHAGEEDRNDDEISVTTETSGAPSAPFASASSLSPLSPDDADDNGDNNLRRAAAKAAGVDNHTEDPTSGRLALTDSKYGFARRGLALRPSPSRVSRRIVLDTVRRVRAAQRRFDDALMAYFRRGGGGDSMTTDGVRRGAVGDGVSDGTTQTADSPFVTRPPTVAVRGRPLRLLQMHRSARRPLALFRPMMTVLEAGGISAHAAFGFQEGVAPNTRDDTGEVEENGRSVLSEHPPERRKTEEGAEERQEGEGDAIDSAHVTRGHQINALLAADVIVGVHGADLHAVAYAKPTSLVTEIVPPMMDGGTNVNGGFFGPTVFARGGDVGYLRVFAHRVRTDPDPEAERSRDEADAEAAALAAAVAGQKINEAAEGEARESTAPTPPLSTPRSSSTMSNKPLPLHEVIGLFSGQVVMPLPDLRQTYAVSVCAWLATSAVRLADEAATSSERDGDESFGAAEAEKASEGPRHQSRKDGGADGGGGDPSHSDSRSSRHKIRRLRKRDRSFDFMIPWWCRGGASAAVRAMLLNTLPKGTAILKLKPWKKGSESNAKSDESQESHHHHAESSGGRDGTNNAACSDDCAVEEEPFTLEAAAASAISPSYYTSRGVPSGYGFVEPHCAPLQPSFFFAMRSVSSTSRGQFFSSLSTSVDHSHLRRLQSECAKLATMGTHGAATFVAKGSTLDLAFLIPSGIPHEMRESEALRTHAEGLQTLLEAVRLPAFAAVRSGGGGGAGGSESEGKAHKSEVKEDLPSDKGLGENSDSSEPVAVSLSPRSAQLLARFIVSGAAVKQPHQRREGIDGVLREAKAMVSLALESYVYDSGALPASFSIAPAVAAVFNASEWAKLPHTPICGDVDLQLHYFMFSAFSGDPSTQHSYRVCIELLLRVALAPRAPPPLPSAFVSIRVGSEGDGSDENADGARRYAEALAAYVRDRTRECSTFLHSARHCWASARIMLLPRLTAAVTAERRRRLEESKRKTAGTCSRRTYQHRHGTPSNASAPKSEEEKLQKPAVKAAEEAAAARKEAIQWVIDQYFRVFGRPTWATRSIPMDADEYPYGADCNRWMP